MKIKNNKGFTLVELLLVIAIIGILAAVLFVSLGKQRERARLTTFKENLRGMVSAATACRDAGGTIQTTVAGNICSDANLGLGVVTAMKQCNGNGANITLTNTNPGADNWTINATCVGTSTNCISTCDINGCVFPSNASSVCE